MRKQGLIKYQLYGYSKIKNEIYILEVTDGSIPTEGYFSTQQIDNQTQMVR